MKYKIITKWNVNDEEFSRIINKHLEKGWRLAGMIQVLIDNYGGDILYVQPLVKKTKEEEE